MNFTVFLYETLLHRTIVNLNVCVYISQSETNEDKICNIVAYHWLSRQDESPEVSSTNGLFAHTNNRMSQIGELLF